MSKHHQYNLTTTQVQALKEVIQVVQCDVCGDVSLMDMAWNDGRHSNECTGSKVTIGLFQAMNADDMAELEEFRRQARRNN